MEKVSGCLLLHVREMDWRVKWTRFPKGVFIDKKAPHA